MIENKVLVLLSAYNGEKYIKEQIDSILNQEYVDVTILVRIDGSKDKTVDILKNFKNNKIIILEDTNIGCVDSFSKLVNYAYTNFQDFDYYAFSDQDDYWKPNKLHKAIEKLKNLPTNKPNLYFCNMELVDAELSRIKELRSFNLDIRRGNILLSGMAAGCVMVFNSKAVELYSMNNPDSNIIYHDYWMLLISFYLGNVVYDPNSYICYRQHGNNVFGASNSLPFLKRIKIKFSFWRKVNDRMQNSAFRSRAFLDAFNDEIKPEDKIALTICANHNSSFICRLKMVFCSDFVPIKSDRNSKNFMTQALKILFNRI